jgi:hypothetical protein
MALNKEIKSSRLLASRRYTHDTFSDGQESFTQTIDISAGEVFTDAGLIPTASLPFSGSTQNGSLIQSGSVNVAKYWYRQKLTRSDTVASGKSEVWFFLDPVGVDGGVGAQLIDANQKTNFISPKYSIPSLANANTEDGTPGYKVKVFVSSNSSTPANGDVISDNNFVFDYKTGVLQFVTNALAPTTSQYVYVSAYQYVGRTLASQLGDGSISGTTTWDSIVSKPAGIVSSSAQTVSNLFGQVVTVNTLIAETYVVSSSVAYITTSFSSGSTQFGDTLDDTHVFSGSLYLISSQSVYRPNISPGTNDFILFVDSGSGELTYKNTIDGGSF